MINVELISPDTTWAMQPRTLDLVARNHELVRAEPPNPTAFIIQPGA